ncbi:MAG TPA: hypothetical protein VGL81_21630 [Polyangiaceae bacterium]|jgi:hypothetical protein
MADDLEGAQRRLCGTCARFVRVVETFDENGEVKRHGECLLGVWPSPLYDTSTCSQWVRRGEFKPRPEATTRRTPSAPRSRGDSDTTDTTTTTHDGGQRALVLPEDLLDMDADEFRRVLAHVIRDELGVGRVEITGRWEGGEMILKPGKPGTQEKHIPLDALFHKVVLIRDKLRVLEQKINSNPKLADDEKMQLQQYITGCYGSLTTFNVLFSNRDDQFVGQKGDE